MEVFAALADPARRDILAALAQRDLSAGEVAALFAISRPAVSRHLRVLREAGLVGDELVGRHRIYRLDGAALVPVMRWLAALVDDRRARPAGPWSGRLDALETEVRRTRRERQSTARPRHEESA